MLALLLVGMLPSNATRDGAVLAATPNVLVSPLDEGQLEDFV